MSRTSARSSTARQERANVYGWQDFYVAEEDGAVVACGGLWDRGCHMRERWRHKTTGEEHAVANTALIDFGYAEGREDSMAALIGRFIGITAELGRDNLMAPLQFVPELSARLERYQPEKEIRAWYWNNNATLRSVSFKPTRPYTDLAYW